MHATDELIPVLEKLRLYASCKPSTAARGRPPRTTCRTPSSRYGCSATRSSDATLSFPSTDSLHTEFQQ